MTRAKKDTIELMAVLTLLQEHVVREEKIFERMSEQIGALAEDVKSLLSSRAFLHGAWFALGIIGAAMLAAVGIVVQYVRGH